MNGVALPALAGFVISSFALIGFKSTDPITRSAQMKMKVHAAGALAGLTGAPGEGTCTQCHGGQVQDGSNENIFKISKNGVEATEYTPGETYDLTLEMTSNPPKKGFEITVLNESNAFVGVFSAGPNTQVKTGGSRKYVTHTGSGNAPDGWSWSWTAPAEISGELRFYIAANKANGNGSSSGDVIFLSQFAINTSARVAENSLFRDVKIGFNGESRNLNISYEFPSSGELTVNMIDLEGKSVFFKSAGKSMEGANKMAFTVPETIGSGLYFVHLLIDNQTVSEKILVY